MRQLIAGVLFASAIVAIAPPALAKSETLKGQLVDQVCYLKDKANNKGVDHKMPAETKNCAVDCAKDGSPVALLAADGKLYTIAGGLAANKNAKLIPHLGQTVEIAGDTMDMKTSMMITADDLKVISK